MKKRKAAAKPESVPLFQKIKGIICEKIPAVDTKRMVMLNMSELQTMKTAVHEATHAMCHDRDIMEELGEKKDRMTKEVEALYSAFHNAYHVQEC